MPLVLDLLRHGEALPSGPGGDAARTLSPAGANALRRLASRLASAGWRPDKAFTSPLRRARETAAIVLGACGQPPEVRTLDELAPDALVAETLAALISRVAGARRVLLVGHQPLMGLLCARLTGENRRFPPGAMVSVECDGPLADGAGRVVAAHSPER